jgi:hypothetical protein
MTRKSRLTSPAVSAAPRAAKAHEPPSLGRMLLLAVALFALALPIIGPLNDHHFAERAHNHDHVYLNGHPVAHYHAYDGLARHAHLRSATLSSRADTGDRSGDILYLTAAVGLTLAALNAPSHPAPETLRPPPLAEAADNPLERFSDRPVRTRGLNVLPPLPPPII